MNKRAESDRGEELIEPPTSARPKDSRTDPELDANIGPDSLVRPSAPTLDSGSGSEPTPAPKPVVVRTSSRPEAATPASDPPREAISTTLRSGPASDETGLIGRRLGRYEVVEELGHGGMATVYRGYDPRLERSVALKVIHRHLRESAEIAQRFRHEARAVAKLKHPSIVEIFDVPDDGDGERFLVAELVEGPSLRRYLQTLGKELAPLARDGRRPSMPPEIAACIVVQVLSALAAAHHEGIVHRDVKPENILIGGLGGPRSQRPSDPVRTPPIVKLTDFGIAKILDGQSMTSTGQILGSPAHMAPEQIEGHDITPRVDIFATGVLFYELLTGELPFDGKNPAQVIRRVLDGQFTPPDRIDATIGGRWSSFVARMLARDPEQRPKDAEQLEAEIRAELAACGVDDANGTLASFMIDPPATTEAWPLRQKPLLVTRAQKSRDAGDSLGAAHDLNRALAYDPTDRRLVEAVGSLRGRARRQQVLRRAVPIAAIGMIIATGSYVGVRALTHRTNTVPSSSVVTGQSTATSAVGGASASTNPLSASSSPSVASSSSVPIKPPSSASVVAIAPDAGRDAQSPGPSTSNGGAAATPKLTRVRFSFYPTNVQDFSVDGQDYPKDGSEREISVGTHKLRATFPVACCDPFDQSVSIAAAADVQTIVVNAKLKPVIVYVRNAPEGDAEVVVSRVGGGTLASKKVTKNPDSFSFDLGGATSAAVVFTLSAGGAVRKTERADAHVGDIKYVDF